MHMCMNMLMQLPQLIPKKISIELGNDSSSVFFKFYKWELENYVKTFKWLSTNTCI